MIAKSQHSSPMLAFQWSAPNKLSLTNKLVSINIHFSKKALPVQILDQSNLLHGLDRTAEHRLDLSIHRFTGQHIPYAMNRFDQLSFPLMIAQFFSESGNHNIDRSIKAIVGDPAQMGDN